MVAMDISTAVSQYGSRWEKAISARSIPTVTVQMAADVRRVERFEGAAALALTAMRTAIASNGTSNSSHHIDSHGVRVSTVAAATIGAMTSPIRLTITAVRAE